MNRSEITSYIKRGYTDDTIIEKYVFSQFESYKYWIRTKQTDNLTPLKARIMPLCFEEDKSKTIRIEDKGRLNSIYIYLFKDDYELELTQKYRTKNSIMCIQFNFHRRELEHQQLY